MNLARQIIETRQPKLYSTFYDFVCRTKSFMNQRAYEGLIDVGALDEFGYNRTTLHQNLVSILEFSKYDGGLFESEFEIKRLRETFTPAEKMKREKELLGFYLNSHPINLVLNQAKDQGWILPSDLDQMNQSTVNCVGFVEKVREIRDKKGNLMAFMDISDESTAITVTIFSTVYKSEYKALLGKVITINGRISIRNGEKNLNFNKIIAVTL